MAIAGLVTGIIGSLGTGGNLLGTAGATPYEARGACMHDVDSAKEMAQMGAEIARLRSEKYADGVRDEAKQYGIEVYKELKGNLTEVTKELTQKIDDLKERQSDKWTDQAVINANLTNAVTALNGQVKSTADLVGQITRTAVPENAICAFGGRDKGGCGCGTNV